jgi:hypothetical protein
VPRTLAVAVVLAASTVASADTGAPGACDQCVVPVAPERPVELARRWGVAARLTSMTLESEAAKTEHAGGGIAASYRLNRRWEFALAFDALDAETGPDLHSLALTARFHLWPLRRWDVYALAGIGSVHEDPTEGSDGEGVSRGQFHIGAGVGHRWTRIGVSAELKGVVLGEPHGDEAAMRSVEPAMTGELEGMELTIAGAFFF